MKIETKYNIGDHVWVVGEVTNEEGVPYEVEVYSEEIESIFYEDELIYNIGDSFVEMREDEIIPYNDLKKLANRIKELDDKIILKQNMEGN